MAKARLIQVEEIYCTRDYRNNGRIIKIAKLSGDEENLVINVTSIGRQRFSGYVKKNVLNPQDVGTFRKGFFIKYFVFYDPIDNQLELEL
jgi:hypothetical protein